MTKETTAAPTTAAAELHSQCGCKDGTEIDELVNRIGLKPMESIIHSPIHR
jgi:hypothetical protein